MYYGPMSIIIDTRIFNNYCSLSVFGTLHLAYLYKHTSDSVNLHVIYAIWADKVPTLYELMILKYKDEGVAKKIRIIRTASHKWKCIASLICDEAHQTNILEQKCQNDPEECLRQVLIHNFIDKKPEHYSQDWNGLIELLDDVGLETIAKEVEHALKSFT